MTRDTRKVSCLAAHHLPVVVDNGANRSNIFQMRLNLKTFYTAVKLFAVASSAFLLLSCGATTGVDSSKDEIAPISCVAVAPTVIPRMDEKLSGEARKNLQTGASYLQDKLMIQVERSSVQRVIGPREAGSYFGEVSGGKRGAVMEAGERLQCESVLLSTLSRFERRRGSKIAVEEPASVAFELELIDSVTGRSLWMSSFDETQTSLFSNLFTFGKAKSRGFTWVTAEEIIDGAVVDKVKSCPYMY